MTKEKIIIPADPYYKSVFAIVNVSGKTYVCPGWHEVPQGTTRDQIEMDMSVIPVVNKVLPDEPKNSSYEVIVKGSKPGKEYKVKFERGDWSCTCPSAMFHRGDCKHIKAEQKNIKISA